MQHQMIIDDVRALQAVVKKLPFVLLGQKLDDLHNSKGSLIPALDLGVNNVSQSRISSVRCFYVRIKLIDKLPPTCVCPFI